MIKAISVFLILTTFSFSAFSQECREDLTAAQYQVDQALESEAMFRRNYEEARTSNRLSTAIFIPSALAFSFIGILPTLGVGAGNVSTFGLVVGAPGLALADSIVTALKLSNAVIPMVLGWSSQAIPAVYALGHGGYRLFFSDGFIDLSHQQLAATIEDLEAAQKKLDAERARIYERANYSQIVDGLLLGSLDRAMALNLYNNSVAGRIIADAKYKLLKIQCQ